MTSRLTYRRPFIASHYPTGSTTPTCPFEDWFKANQPTNPKSVALTPSSTPSSAQFFTLDSIRCIPIILENTLSQSNPELTTNHKPTDRPTDQPTNQPTNQPGSPTWCHIFRRQGCLLMMFGSRRTWHLAYQAHGSYQALVQAICNEDWNICHLCYLFIYVFQCICMYIL